MNRGSARTAGSLDRECPSFNEAPIHESGKSFALLYRIVNGWKLQ